MKHWFVSLLVVFLFAQNALSQLNRSALTAFVERIVKDRSSSFTIEAIPQQDGKDVFELESRKGKIVLRGNNGLSVAAALNYYLQQYCNCQLSWNGVNMHLPAQLPVVTKKVHKATPYKYRYYLNYCTFQYSMSWWDWERWQQEIDWMALNGINMPLALTGEESIWQQVYKKMGFTDNELAGFFTGPAYFSWLWMGNIDGWDGPLPQHWMDRQKELQKQILERERSFGMKPVLPAFTGHVPNSFNQKFPNAKIKKTNWGAGFPDVYILDPADALFESVGKQFIEAQTAAYGTDHFYSADTFNENVPPTKDSAFLDAMSKKVFQSMAGADTAAVWVMQGWMFHYNSDYWQPTQIKALLNAVPDDHMIILDLYSESHPVWNRTDAYYGKPWIWNMLHNFGGNISLWGRMANAAKDPAAALHHKSSRRMEGIGLTMEGIEQNPALYHLMLENVWNEAGVDLIKWLSQYATQRYGVHNEIIDSAWRILEKTVYNGGLGEGGPESIIVARPTSNMFGDRVRTKLDYDPAVLVSAWALFIQTIPDLQQSDGFQYDLVDITRQVLANYATPLQQKWVLAYLQHDAGSFTKYSQEFLELMDDMDELLATRKDFLLGKWIADARSCGADENEKKLYELNARNVITLWGDKESELHEYSCRQWAGLIKGFYKPRWQLFFTDLQQKMATGARMEMNDFESAVKTWEWNWVNSNDTYSASPSGSAIEVSKRLYTKYLNRVK